MALPFPLPRRSYGTPPFLPQPGQPSSDPDPLLGQLAGSWGSSLPTRASEEFEADSGNLPPMSLPKPPPSAKKATPWDSEHLSETLAGIAQGFLSHQNFGEGLGAAAGSIGDRMKTIREEGRKSVALGGPDSAFEVITDPQTGERTYRPIEAFQTYAADKYKREHAPSLSDSRKATSAAMTAVLNLPVAQRAQAAAAAKAKLKEQGYDVGHLPDAENYSDMAATMARDMGVDTVVQERWDRDERRDAATDQYRQANLGIRQSQLGISRDREARAATKASSLPKAPPRKGYSVPRTRADFEALPRGAKFMAPDGSMRIKQ